MYYTDMTHNIICTSYTKSIIVVNVFCRIFKNKVYVLFHEFKNY